ncbi:MAG: hypothetical protein ACE5LV_05575 [Candidatus Aminicenantales bacterium]
MIWWVLLLVVVTVLSYLSDTGVLPFLKEWQVPYVNASLLSLLILLSLIGLLGRMMQMSKRGEKEALKDKIRKLEEEVATLKKKEE